MNSTPLKQKQLSSLIAITIILIFSYLPLLAQNKAAYIIPDIGTPGTSIYIELLAHHDSLGAFGSDASIKDSSIYLATASPSDR